MHRFPFSSTTIKWPGTCSTGSAGMCSDTFQKGIATWEGRCYDSADVDASSSLFIPKIFLPTGRIFISWVFLLSPLTMSQVRAHGLEYLVPQPRRRFYAFHLPRS